MPFDRLFPETDLRPEEMVRVCRADAVVGAPVAGYVYVERLNGALAGLVKSDSLAPVAGRLQEDECRS